MKKCRKSKISTAIVLIFVLSLGMTKLCFAENNYHDTAYRFKFSNYQPYYGWHTEKRDKLDYTSSYMSCSAASGLSYDAWVTASNSKDNEYVTDVGSPHYKFYAGTTTKMINYVKERGYKYAAISAKPNADGSYTAEGLWSPDSI